MTTTRRTCGLLGAALLFALPAAAQTALVTTSGSAKAGERVENKVIGETGALEPVDLASLLAGKPIQLSGDGNITICATQVPVPTAELERLLDGAEASVRTGDYEYAVAEFAGVADDIVCAAEILDDDLMARFFMLRGIAEAEYGHHDAAREDFLIALRFADKLAWSDVKQLSTDLAREPFKEARALYKEDTRNKVNLQLVPAPEGRLFVDGRPAGGSDTLTLSAGDHVVQVKRGDRVDTMLLHLGGGDDPALIFPEQLNAAVAKWTSDERGRRNLSTVLELAFGPGKDVVVHTGNRVFRTTTGVEDWTRLPVKSPVDEILIVTGGTMLAGGGVSSLVIFLVGTDYRQSCEETLGLRDPSGRLESREPPEGGYCGEQRELAYSNLQSVLPVTEALGAGGAGLLVVGVVLNRVEAGRERKASDQASLALQPTRNGLSIRFRIDLP